MRSALFDQTGQQADFTGQLLIALHEFLNLADSMQHGGVITIAEPAADLGQRARCQLLGQVHADLTRPHDGAGPARAEQVRAGDVVVTAHNAQDVLPKRSPRAKRKFMHFHVVMMKQGNRWVVKKRDVKGLYKKARAGEIKEFTGIDAPFDEPSSPDLEIRTDLLSEEESLNHLVNAVIPLVRIK